MSGIYERGNIVELVAPFAVINASGAAVPADPTAVVFRVTDPEGDIRSYKFGVDGNVAHPATGQYVCQLGGSLAPGVYHYVALGTGAVVAKSFGTFTVIDTGAPPPAPEGLVHELVFIRPIPLGGESSAVYTDVPRLAESDWGDVLATPEQWAYLLEQAENSTPDPSEALYALFGCGTANTGDGAPFVSCTYSTTGTSIVFGTPNSRITSGPFGAPGTSATELSPGPLLGPCTSWINGADVARCCSLDLGSSTSAIYDTVAAEAAMLLFEKSGRQFSGACYRTVRPCRDGCGCWGGGGSASGFSWYGGGYGTSFLGPFGWYNEGGDRCGCGPTSVVRLAGYPVRDVLEVRIDGNVLAPYDENGNPNYRLDGRTDLVRLDDPVSGAVRQWPNCQNLSLDDSQKGTFAITYRHGVDPPQLGRDAAAALACELAKSCGGLADCQLPAGATKVIRQGIEIDRGLLTDWLDPKKPTGLVVVDAFLAAYWPRKTGRRPAIFSPDVQQFAREVGQ